MSVRGGLAWAALALTMLLWSACAVQAASEPTTVSLVLHDHYFQPDTVQLKVGERVRVELVNEGQIPHAFMVGLELQRLTWGPDERLAQDFFSGVELDNSVSKGVVEDARGFEVTLQPGGRAALVFTVPAEKAGAWEIGCLVPGHYESGMRGTLIVER